MNHTPPPPGAPNNAAPQQSPLGAGFFAWLRGLNIARGSDRWFAGVAGGLAARAGIDPIIVRGIFIVLAVLGGPGIVLYLAAWLLLPGVDGKIHLEEVFRGRASTAAVVATVAVGVFVVFPVFFRLLGISGVSGWSLWNAFGMPGWFSTTVTVLVWIAVLGGAAFLLSRLLLARGRNVRDRAVPQQAGQQADAAPGAGSPGDAPFGDAPFGAAPAGTGTSGAASPAQGAASFVSAPPGETQAAAAAGASTHAGQAGSTATDPGARVGGAPASDPAASASANWTQRLTDTAERASQKASRWGEDLGKQADDWSARYAAQHDLMKLGAAHVVITLALALLAAGGAALVALQLGLHTDHVRTAALLGATGVLAVSIIVAGVRGRHTGWIGFLALCGVVALLFTSVLPDGSRFQPFGNVDVSTTTPSSVLLAGTSDLDLGALDDSDAPDDIDLWHVTGRSVITLPESAPIVLTIRVLAGNIDASDISRAASTAAGPFLSRTIDTRDDAADPATRVTVYMLAGSVRVDEPARHRPTSRDADRDARQDRDEAAATERKELRSELAALRADEAGLRDELESSDLSEFREQRLQNTLEFTRDEITQLEKELAR